MAVQLFCGSGKLLISSSTVRDSDFISEQRQPLWDRLCSGYVSCSDFSRKLTLTFDHGP